MENENNDLEKRVKQLEEDLDRTESFIADMHPFSHICLEYGVIKAQENRILELMQEVEESLKANKKAISRREFEDKIYQIIPKLKNNFPFVQSVVMSLNNEGKYPRVYEYMKAHGL